MRDLTSYLPEAYDGSPESLAVQNAIQPEMARLWSAKEDFLLQLNVDTATWGLRLWEEAVGLGYDPELGADVRRGRVKVKLRGAVTTTPEVVKELVAAFVDGTVELEEYPRESAVVITITGTGAPLLLEDRIAASLKYVMPAHLRWSFVVRFPPIPGRLVLGVSGMDVAIAPVPETADRLDCDYALRMGAVLCQHAKTPVPETV